MNIGRIENVSAGADTQILAEVAQAAPRASNAVYDARELARPRPTLTSGGALGTPLGLPAPGTLQSPVDNSARIEAAIKDWTAAVAAESVDTPPPAAPAAGPDVAARAEILATRIAALKAATDALNEGNSPLGLQVLSDVTVPGLEAMLAQHRAALNDPQAGTRERVMNTILGQTERLVEVMTDMRRTLPDEVLASRRVLQEGGIPTGWAAVELNNLVGAANRIAEASARQPIGEAVEQLAQAITQHRLRLATAVSLDQQRRGVLTPSIADTAELVARTREELARGITANAKLDTPPTPETLLTEARAQVDAMRTALGSGDLEAATRARDAAKAAVQKVREQIDAAKRAAEK